jgi:hypothetical protein
MILDVGVCHQKKIREEKKITDTDNLFGAYWEGVNKTIKNAVVREVSVSTAKSIVEEYEWLGCMPAVVWYCYGIFFENFCAGVVCYGPEYSENLGKIGFPVAVSIHLLKSIVLSKSGLVKTFDNNLA